MSKRMSFRSLRRAMRFNRQVMMLLPDDPITDRMRHRMVKGIVVQIDLSGSRLVDLEPDVRNGGPVRVEWEDGFRGWYKPEELMFADRLTFCANLARRGKRLMRI